MYNKGMSTPTHELYEPLVLAYDHFNHYLFAGELPTVIFTLQRKKNVMGYFAAQRWGNTKGETCSEIAINPSYFANCRMIEVFQTLVHEMVHAWQARFGHCVDAHYHNKEWAQKMISIGLMPSSTGEPGGATVGRQMSDYIIKRGRFIEVADLLLSDKSYQLKWVDRFALPRLHDSVIADMDITYHHNQSSGQSDDVSVVPQCINSESLEMHYSNSENEHHMPATHSLPTSFFVEEVARKQTRSKFECPSCQVKVYGKHELNIICGDCHTPFVKSN